MKNVNSSVAFSLTAGQEVSWIYDNWKLVLWKESNIKF
jgi:hypothetical protein